MTMCICGHSAAEHYSDVCIVKGTAHRGMWADDCVAFTLAAPLAMEPLPWCNLPGCPEHGEHRITTGRCLLIPAAPSEPPTADSPTPGTHRMLAGSHEQPGGAECRCGAPWDRWNDRCTQPTAPSPVDTTEPPAYITSPALLRDPLLRPLPELPAETRQGGECDRYGHTEADHDAVGACQRPSLDARVAASATEYPRGSDLAVAFERGWDAHRRRVALDVERDAALAARSSADTEKLREQVETWIDEAPEHTAGLDLLRQIIAPDHGPIQ